MTEVQINQETSTSPTRREPLLGSPKEKEVLRCDICNSDDVDILLANLSFCHDVDGDAKEWKYRLLKCRSCGLGFVDPKPSFERLCSFYKGDYGCYASSNTDTINNNMKYWIAKCRYATYRNRGLLQISQTVIGWIAEWITGKTISFPLGIPLHLPKDARIFEIGYGSGDWLLSMSRLGYQNLHGYDIDANTDNASRLSSAGIKASGGDFLSNNYEEASFDCIRMEHVIEHLLKPKEVLSKCYRLLKPGGILVSNFPCIDSWVAKISLQHFNALDLPRHLYHHTPQSARRLFESHGFDVIKSKPYAVLTHLPVCLNAVLGDTITGRVKIPSFVFLPFAPFYRLFCSLTHKGEFQTMLCRRGIPPE